MAETPQYQRDTPIKPAQAVQGFSDATSQFASFSSNIGQIGATLAQESANKLAQIQGIEDSKRNAKEGKLRPMLPSFTEADKHYAAAYEQEQSQELAFQGQQMLQSFMRTAAKTPTGAALGDYEQFGKSGIDDIVSKAPRAMQSHLRRSLEDSYLNGFHKLADRVEQANKQYIESQDVAIANAQLDSINELLEGGDLTGAEAALWTRKEDIKAKAQQYKDTGGQEGYAPHVAIAAMKQADDRWHQALLNQGWKDAERLGKGDEFLKNARKKKPEQWTDAQHDQYVKGMVSYANEYKAALSAQQTNDFIRYATKVDTDQMTQADLLYAQEKLSEKQMAELERRIALRDYKNGSATALFNQYQPGFQSEGAMAAVSGTEKMDKILDRQVQFNAAIREHETGQTQEIGIADIANSAREIKAMSPKFNKQLGAMMKSDNPQVAYQTAKIFANLDTLNPKSVEGVGNDAVMFAKKMLSATESGASVQEAHVNANEGLQKLTAVQKEERGKEFDEQLRLFGSKQSESLNLISNRKAFVLEAMGVDNPGFWGRKFLGRATVAVPDGLSTQFMESMRDFYTRGMDFDQSKEMASRQLGRVWKMTDVNGSPQMMWMAPEMFLGEGGADIVKQDMADQIQAQFNDGQTTISGFKFHLSEGDVPPPFSWSNVLKGEYMARYREPADPRTVEEFKGKPVTMTMTDASGKSVHGQVMIVTDKDTNKTNPGELASYAVEFIPDGRSIPRMLTLPNGAKFRYTLTEASVKNAQAKHDQKMEAINKQAIADKERAAKVFELRENSIWESNSER